MATTNGSIFVTPDEHEVAHLTTASVSAGTAVGKDYIILSNKRLYYKGNAVALNGSNQYASGESIVDLKNVTGTSFSIARSPALLVLGILMLLAFAVIFAISEGDAGFLPFVFVVIAVVCFLAYAFSGVKIFVVNYRGGTLSFQLKGLSIGASADTFRSFCHAIHATASKLNENP